MSHERLKPFQFSNLERLSRSQVDLHRGVLNFLPSAINAQSLTTAFSKILSHYLREQVTIELTAIREPDFKKYCFTIPDPTVLLAMSCVPIDQRAFLQVDFALAHVMIDRMLGGEGLFPPELKGMSQIEEGIVKYIALKLMNTFAEHAQGYDIQFRLEKVLSEPKALVEMGQEDDLIALLSFQITVGKKAGFARLALPHPLVQGLLGQFSPQERMITKKDLHRLERLFNIKIPIWIEMGRVNIDSIDLANLEKGDVVLLDEIYLELGETGVTGPVTVRISEGVGGGVKGNIIGTTEDRVSVAVESLF